MDVLSGLVVWMLMIFMQACPVDRLAVGDAYYFSVDSQNKTLVISVTSVTPPSVPLKGETGRKDKEGWVSLSAGIEEPGSPKLSRVHNAVLSFGGGRKVTRLEEGKENLLTKPISFSSLEKQLLIGTDANFIYTRSKLPGAAPGAQSVAGYSGKLNVKSLKYDQGQDHVDVGVDPNLGAVFVTFTNAGDVMGLQLARIVRKKH